MGTGVGPLSFFMREMGCEKACVLPLDPVRCVHLCRAYDRTTVQRQVERDSKSHGPGVTFQKSQRKEMEASLENCLHFPDQKRYKVSEGLYSIRRRGFVSVTLACRPVGPSCYARCTRGVQISRAKKSSTGTCGFLEGKNFQILAKRIWR